MAKKREYPPGTKMQPILREMEEDRLAFWRGLTKGAWIDAARSEFSVGEGERCEVCNRLASIAQAHHLIPLGEQYDRGFVTPNQRHAWLCPNHHAMLHLFMRQRDFRIQGIATLRVIYDLSDEQIQRMADLVARSREGK